MERLEVALRREVVRRRLAGESPEVIAASWAVRAGGEPSRGSIERLQTDVTRLSGGAEQLGQCVEDPQPRVDELEQRQSADGSSP